MPHSLGSGTISFGLVSIPVRLYAAASPGGVSFHLLHANCGNRIRQQLFCTVCNRTVDRSELVRGYEFAREQYVRFSDEELKALENEASTIIEIAEFVPLPAVDPVYFERAYYLGPDKGGEKAYRLLAEAMAKADRVALAKFAMRGKENLVLIRPVQHGLMLHTMYFADEVRDFGEIDKGAASAVRDDELQLAIRLIEELSRDEFKPEEFRDEYRDRVLEVVDRKVEGKEVTTAPPPAAPAQVIDLMDALRQSLAKGAQAGTAEPAAERKRPGKAPARPPRRASEPTRRARAGGH